MTPKVLSSPTYTDVRKRARKTLAKKRAVAPGETAESIAACIVAANPANVMMETVAREFRYELYIPHHIKDILDTKQQLRSRVLDILCDHFKCEYVDVFYTVHYDYGQSDAGSIGSEISEKSVSSENSL